VTGLGHAVLARLPTPTIPPDEVRRAVEAVLRDPAYTEVRPTLMQRAWQWVAARVADVLDALVGTGTGNVVGAVVLVVALVAILALLARLAFSLRRDPERDAAVADVVGRTAADWRDEAAGHERAGELRLAVRAEYRALVAELAAAGLVDEVPGRTSGEYRSAVRRDVPAAADDFAAVTGTFEAAWYGSRPVTAEDLATVRAESGRALRAATGRRPVPAGAA
jgi:hypothetical protein